MWRRETEQGDAGVEAALFCRLARAVCAAIERERPRLDGLDVHPVPDGDTGLNLLLTVNSLVGELEEATDDRLAPQWLARTLLMGARGTSGVILSQIVRGAVERAPAAGSPLNSRALAKMLARSSEAAYRAVHKPLEGTMLTLIRELAKESRSRRFRKLNEAGLLDALVERGEEVLAETPERLQVLKENGVVDAGAAGLMVCLRAIAKELSDERDEEPVRALRLVTETVQA